MMPRRAHRLVIGLALLLLSGELFLPTAMMALEAGDLLDAPAAYDGKPVTITGTASEPRLNARQGQTFTLFNLTDRGF